MTEESWPDLEGLIKDIAREGVCNTQERRKWLDLHAALLLRQIRSRYGPMVFVEVDVLVPLCYDCKHSECRWLETPFPQLPHVFSENWRENYRERGIPKKKESEASKALRHGTWRGPSCYQCGSIIQLDVEGGEGFYLKTVSISSFYSLSKGNGRRPPKRMKDIIFKAYKGKCSLCPTILNANEATADHIVAWSDGGETCLENLQLMCQRCNNQEKKNLPVEKVCHPSLYFPLLPFSDKLLD